MITIIPEKVAWGGWEPGATGSKTQIWETLEEHFWEDQIWDTSYESSDLGFLLDSVKGDT